MIVRALSADNTKLAKCDRVTIDSIRNHTVRHFPAQNIARATYREILERRAKANGADFVEGVAAALTPLAFLETVMVKSYETLIDSNTKVDVHTGMIAAGRLQSLIETRDASRDIAELRFQLGKIGEAVKSTVPQEMWATIVEKLEELEQHPEALDVGEDGFDDADDDPYDPMEFAEWTTSFDLRPSCLAPHRGSGHRCRCGRGVRGTPAAPAENLAAATSIVRCSRAPRQRNPAPASAARQRP